MPVFMCCLISIQISKGFEGIEGRPVQEYCPTGCGHKVTSKQS